MLLEPFGLSTVPWEWFWAAAALLASLGARHSKVMAGSILHIALAVSS